MMMIMMSMISMLMIKNNFKYMNLMMHNFIFIIIFFMLFTLNMKLNLFNNIFFFYSFDSFTYILIMMTFWIISFSIMSNLNFMFFKNKNKFMFLMMMTMIFINLFFLSMNLLLFFIFFESSLIPIILLIMGWGNQIDRIQASMYMLFYTLFGSLPLIILIIFLYKSYWTNLIYLIYMMKMYMIINYKMFLIMNLGFLIKLPLYIMHLWLPKAHVESPISGSMILAGLMLKLGSYGMLRFIYMFMYLYNKYNLMLILMSIWGSILCCFMCLNMNDMKMIIAYSSIIHMGSMIASLFVLYSWSMLSNLLMMVAHGLCSPLLFYLSYIIYERSHSRNMYFNKGIINILPNLTMWWFLISFCNMSSPPSLNLISEIIIILSLIKFSNIFLIINFFLIFFSSLYNIYFYYNTQNKLWNYMNFNFYYLNLKEKMILFVNWFILNILFLNLYLFLL